MNSSVKQFLVLLILLALFNIFFIPSFSGNAKLVSSQKTIEYTIPTQETYVIKDLLVYQYNDTLYALNKMEGSIMWKLPMSTTKENLFVTQTGLYFLNPNFMVLYKVDLETGRISWGKELGGERNWMSYQIDNDGFVICLLLQNFSNNEVFQLIDAESGVSLDLMENGISTRMLEEEMFHLIEIFKQEWSWDSIKVFTKIKAFYDLKEGVMYRYPKDRIIKTKDYLFGLEETINTTSLFYQKRGEGPNPDSKSFPLGDLNDYHFSNNHFVEQPSFYNCFNQELNTTTYAPVALDKVLVNEAYFVFYNEKEIQLVDNKTLASKNLNSEEYIHKVLIDVAHIYVVTSKTATNNPENYKVAVVPLDFENQ